MINFLLLNLNGIAKIYFLEDDNMETIEDAFNYRRSLINFFSEPDMIRSAYLHFTNWMLTTPAVYWPDYQDRAAFIYNQTILELNSFGVLTEEEKDLLIRADNDEEFDTLLDRLSAIRMLARDQSVRDLARELMQNAEGEEE